MLRAPLHSLLFHSILSLSVRSALSVPTAFGSFCSTQLRSVLVCFGCDWYAMRGSCPLSTPHPSQRGVGRRLKWKRIENWRVQIHPSNPFHIHVRIPTKPIPFQSSRAEPSFGRGHSLGQATGRPADCPAPTGAAAPVRAGPQLRRSPQTCEPAELFARRRSATESISAKLSQAIGPLFSTFVPN